MADNREEHLLLLWQDTWVFYSPCVSWWVQIKLGGLNHKAGSIKKSNVQMPRSEAQLISWHRHQHPWHHEFHLQGKTDDTIFFCRGGIRLCWGCSVIFCLGFVCVCVCRHVPGGEGLDIQIFLPLSWFSLGQKKKKEIRGRVENSGHKFDLIGVSVSLIFNIIYVMCTHRHKQREMFPFGLQDFITVCTAALVKLRRMKCKMLQCGWIYKAKNPS